MRHASSRWMLAVLLALAAIGCSADQPLNSSFAITHADAKQALRDMEAEPVEPRRPVLVLGGWIDPGFATGHLTRQLKRVLGDGQVVDVSFAFCGSFDSCRDRLMRRLEETLPSDEPGWTTEVDVVAVSMGGLVARYAAAPPPPPPEVDGNSEADDESGSDAPPHRRLRIARLFTIATPHRGARMAVLPTFDRLQIDMRPGSPFIQALDEALAGGDYELVPYVRLGDLTVGQANAAPPGVTPWWVATPCCQGGHLDAYRDPRIVADIARRLRGEAGYTAGPAADWPAGHRP